MDVYKLRIDHVGSTPISKDTFEEETRCRDPWYQPGASDKDSHFAVCPACDSPIQLIGLYELPANVTKPFGKHATSSIRGVAQYNSEAKENCPYFKPRIRQKSDRKTTFDGTPEKILQLLIEQFDRVVYILEKQTGLVFSRNALLGMLERYRDERGFMYTGATLRNVPWMFAYMSNATDLYGQLISNNKALTAAILEQVPTAVIGSDGRVTSRPPQDGAKAPFLDLKVSYIKHRFKKERDEDGLSESMTMVVSLKQGKKIQDVHKQVIEFDHTRFENLIRKSGDETCRRMDRVQLARDKLGHLLKKQRP